MNAATISILLAKGLSGVDILEVAQAMESAAPRSTNAERQARYRERGGGKIPESMRRAVFDRDGWVCLDCGSTEYLCCDHVIPVSKGGDTSLENLQTLCRPCNSKKKDRIRKRDQKRKSSGNSVEIPGNPSPNERDILTPSLTPVISDEITPPAEIEELKPEHVLEAYNATAVRIGLPQARMTPERRKKLSGFVRRHAIDDITEAIHALETSPFLRGENDRGWKADFDFLLQPKSFTKLIEGTYGR